MRTLRLFGIESGDTCPDTGTWYANYQENKGIVSYDSTQTFRLGEQFPELNGKPTKWIYFVEID